MGRNLTTRSTFLFAAGGTAVWLVVMRYMYQTSYQELAVTGAIYFVIIFGTMLMTNRMTGALTRRVEAREALKRAESRGPATTEPTSDRIEHNQRRRQRADRARAERRRRQ